MQMLLLHSVFCPAFKAADNQVIQWRMALSARRPSLEFLLGNAILCAAIEAPDDNVFLHIHTAFKYMIILENPVWPDNRQLFPRGGFAQPRHFL